MQRSILIQKPEPDKQNRPISYEDRLKVEMIIKRMHNLLKNDMLKEEKIGGDNFLSLLRRFIKIDYRAGHIPSFEELLKLDDKDFVHNLLIIADIKEYGEE